MSEPKITKLQEIYLVRLPGSISPTMFTDHESAKLAAKAHENSAEAVRLSLKLAVVRERLRTMAETQGQATVANAFFALDSEGLFG